MTTTADIIIIGNGSLGLSTAHALAERDPALKIMVVGPRARPYAASAAAGAMLTPFGEVTTNCWDNAFGRAKIQHSIDALKAWPEWLASVNARAGEETRAEIARGCFSVNNTMSGTMEDENFDEMIKVLEATGEPYERVSPRAIPGFYPVDSQRPLRAIFVPGEGSIDSGRLLAALESSLRSRPHVDLVDASVEKLIVEGDSIRGVDLSDGRRVAAREVVVAAGILTQRLLDQLPDLARRIPRLFAGAGTAVLLRVPGVELCPSVVRTPNRAFACGLHQVPRGGDHVYIGATNQAVHMIETSPDHKGEGGGDYRDSDLPSVTDMHFLLDCALDQLNQSYDFARIVRSFSGARPLSVDSFPLIGSTSVGGLWIVAGTFRDGLTISPIVARGIADQVVSGRKTPADDAFRPERPPISYLTREEAIQETLLHSMAAGAEHKLKLPTIGWHRSLGEMLGGQITAVYEAVGTDYVPPPVMYSVAMAHHDHLREYYAQTKRVWS